MDDGVRSGRVLLKTAIAIAFFAGCGARDPMAVVGTSTTGGSATRTLASDAGAAPTPPAIPSDFRTSFTKVNRARFMSRGHLEDRFAVDVYVNAAAERVWRSDTSAIPAGAMLVKEQFDPSPADRPAGILAMEKREAGFDPENGDWRWIVVSAKGEIVKDGKLEQCSGCHRESKHDFVFVVK